MGSETEQRSLEETPTWAVSICCLFVLVISLIIEGGLHKFTEVIITILLLLLLLWSALIKMYV